MGYLKKKKNQYPGCHQNHWKWNPWAPDISIFINTQVIPGSRQGCEPPDFMGEERALGVLVMWMRFSCTSAPKLLLAAWRVTWSTDKRAGDFSPPSNNKVMGISGGWDFLVSREVQKILFRNSPGVPVATHPVCNAGDTGSNTDPGTKLPHAKGQLCPCTATTEAQVP